MSELLLTYAINKYIVKVVNDICRKRRCVQCQDRENGEKFALKKSVCCSPWHLQSPHRALGAVFKLQEANCPWRCLCLGPRGQDSETQAPWSLAGAGAHTTVISAVGICAQDVSTSMLIPPIPRGQGPSFLDNFFQKLVACIQKCLSPCEFLFTFYSLFTIKDYLQAKVGCSIF